MLPQQQLHTLDFLDLDIRFVRDPSDPAARALEAPTLPPPLPAARALPAAVDTCEHRAGPRPGPGTRPSTRALRAAPSGCAAADPRSTQARSTCRDARQRFPQRTRWARRSPCRPADRAGPQPPCRPGRRPARDAGSVYQHRKEGVCECVYRGGVWVSLSLDGVGCGSHSRLMGWGVGLTLA